MSNSNNASFIRLDGTSTVVKYESFRHLCKIAKGELASDSLVKIHSPVITTHHGEYLTYKVGELVRELVVHLDPPKVS